MGFFNSCWPFGQQLYKLDIAEVLKTAKEAEAAAKAAAEAVETALAGTVKSVNGHTPDASGNAEIPGFIINQEGSNSLEMKGYWNGRSPSITSISLNMGFRYIGDGSVIDGAKLSELPGYLRGSYTIHGLPFTTSFAYAFVDPHAASQNVVIIEPATGKLYNFYLDGETAKMDSSTIGESGGGDAPSEGGGGNVYRHAITTTEPVSAITIPLPATFPDKFVQFNCNAVFRNNAQAFNLNVKVGGVDAATTASLLWGQNVPSGDLPGGNLYGLRGRGASFFVTRKISALVYQAVPDGAFTIWDLYSAEQANSLTVYATSGSGYFPANTTIEFWGVYEQ